MRLGNYFEVRSTVPGLADAEAFYQTLGYKHIADHVWTDGSFNLRLAQDESGIGLWFYGSPPEALEKFGSSQTSPNGVTVHFNKQESAIPMPAGDPMTRTPVSHCGKFGEFSISVQDFDTALAFWVSLGYKKMLAETEPYPWGIAMDDFFVIGLHESLSEKNTSQPQFTEPHITYFDKDMPGRIEKLASLGIEMKELGKNKEGKTSAVEFAGPGTLLFSMFTGEI